MAAFRIFPFRILPVIPQIFSAPDFPHFTRCRFSAFRNPHSAFYPNPSINVKQKTMPVMKASLELRNPLRRLTCFARRVRTKHARPDARQSWHAANVYRDPALSLTSTAGIVRTCHVFNLSCLQLKRKWNIECLLKTRRK